MTVADEAGCRPPISRSGPSGPSGTIGATTAGTRPGRARSPHFRAGSRGAERRRL